jgi:hypothetical protein
MVMAFRGYEAGHSNVLMLDCFDANWGRELGLLLFSRGANIVYRK